MRLHAPPIGGSWGGSGGAWGRHPLPAAGCRRCLLLAPCFDALLGAGDGGDERRVQRVGVRRGDDDELLEQFERVLGDVLLLAGELAEVVVAADPFSPSDDGVAEGDERAEEGDLRDERLVEGVDAGEGVVEFAVGVADEGHGGDVAERVAGPLVENDGTLAVRGRRVADDVRDEVEDEVPVELHLGALGQVVHALDRVALEAAAGSVGALVAVVDERASVQELTPLLFLGGVGDRRVERGPDEVPRRSDAESLVPRCLAVRAVEVEAGDEEFMVIKAEFSHLSLSRRDK